MSEKRNHCKELMERAAEDIRACLISDNVGLMLVSFLAWNNGNCWWMEMKSLQMLALLSFNSPKGHISVSFRWLLFSGFYESYCSEHRGTDFCSGIKLITLQDEGWVCVSTLLPRDTFHHIMIQWQRPHHEEKLLICVNYPVLCILL